MAREKLKEHEINRDWCKGCGICVQFCPKQVLELDTIEKIIKVLEKRIPKNFLAMNHLALDIGLILGSQYQYKILS